MIRSRLFLTSAAALLALSLAAAPAVRADDVPAPGASAPAAETPAVGVQFEAGTPAFADVLAKAKAAGKPVFIDFTTEWCGWCRKLEKDTYSQASVGKMMQGFVNVMIDAEKGEGIELAKRYGVSGFPTLVVVDASGDEVDRIVGYRAPEPFTKDVQRILAGEGTLPALRAAYTAAPDDVAAGLALGTKLAVSKPTDAATLFAHLVETSKSQDRATQANVHLEYAAALLATRQLEPAMAEAEILVRDFADTPAAGKAAARVGGAFIRGDAKRALAFLDAARGAATESQDKVLIEQYTVAVHKAGIAASLKRQGEAAGDDPQALNAVAWTCFEQKMNVRDAIGWARTAVEKSNRDAAILDTLANLLWLTGTPDARAEALKLETEAAGKGEGAMAKEFKSLVARWNAESQAVQERSDEDGEREDGDSDDDGDGEDEMYDD